MTNIKAFYFLIFLTPALSACVQVNAGKEIYLINTYWLIAGTVPKEYLGGIFLIIIESRNYKIIKMTHRK
jgi:hypothetical protein